MDQQAKRVSILTGVIDFNHHEESEAFPGGANGKEPACLCRRHKRHRFDPWVGIPWRRAWQPTPVFLARESCRQRSLVGYSPWSHSHMAEAMQHGMDEESGLHVLNEVEGLFRISLGVSWCLHTY